MMEPQIVVDWLLVSGRSESAKSAFSEVFEQLAEHDIEAAIANLERIQGLNFREDALRIAVSHLAETDAGRAMALCRSLPQSARVSGENAVVQVWARSDPERAADHYLTTGNFNGTLGNVLEIWARRDASAAMTWIDKQAFPMSERQRYLMRILDSLAAMDPARTVDILVQMPNAERRYFYGSIARQWASSDPVAAAEWIKNLADPQVQADAITSAVESIPLGDIETAMDLIDVLPGDTRRDQVFGALARRRANSDPQGTVAWADMLEDPHQRLIGLQNGVGMWAASQPEKAGAYVFDEVAIADQAALLEAAVEEIHPTALGSTEEQINRLRNLSESLTYYQQQAVADAILSVHGDQLPAAIKGHLKNLQDLDAALALLPTLISD